MKMIVKDQREHNITEFGNLTRGDTFVYEASLYVVCELNTNGSNVYNLNHNFNTFLSESALVEQVNVEVIIKNGS